MILCVPPAIAADTARQTIVKAMIEEDDDKKIALITALIGSSDEDIKPLLAAWKEDTIYIYKAVGDNAPKRRTPRTNRRPPWCSTALR